MGLDGSAGRGVFPVCSDVYSEDGREYAVSCFYRHRCAGFRWWCSFGEGHEGHRLQSPLRGGCGVCGMLSACVSFQQSVAAVLLGALDCSVYLDHERQEMAYTGILG